MSVSQAKVALTAKLTGALVLAGAGKMGGALLRGWLEAGIDPARMVVLEPAPTPDLLALAAESRFRLNPAIASVQDAEVIVLALKPQGMSAALPALLPLQAQDALILSIAAGKPSRFFERIFGAQAPVVRAMPNLPAAIGRGISVLYANNQVTITQRKLAGDLLSAVGGVTWIEDEALMDPVTAVSGSGPAYVFLLIECLANAGVAAGLDAALARRLAAETVSGAGELAAQAGESAAVLRQNVTSPGGTTAAALEVLMAPDGMQQLLSRAVLAAARRSAELAD